MQPSTPLRSLLVASTVAFAAQGALAFETRGFRGLAWGDSPQGLGQARLVSDHDGKRCYERRDEPLMFGDSALRAVQYCFRDDKLYMVRLDATSRLPELATEFQVNHGHPNGRTQRRASWGSLDSPTRAEIVSTAGVTPGSVLSIVSTRHAGDAH